MSKTLPHDTLESLSPQDRLVYDFLLSGRGITSMVAMVNLGVASLTARIATLRKKGLEVSDEWAEDHFEKRYKRYWVETE